MTTQQIAVRLGSEIVYVTGTVNGVDKVFTLQEGNIWTTTADKAQDNTYHIVLLCVDAVGNQTNFETTLFYGINLIFDRTKADVDFAKMLRDKIQDEQTLTPEEQQLYNAGLRGAYNATDLNRVEIAVKVISDLLNLYGYSHAIVTKTDWTKSDIMQYGDTVRYLGNVDTVRSVFCTYPDTPDLPDSMSKLGYIKANNIEKILYDIYELIGKMEQSFYYSGEFYAGEG